MNLEATVLIDLVASVLQNRGATNSTANVNWERLFELARRQRVANIVGCALERKDVPVSSVPTEIQTRFAREKMNAIFVETLRSAEMEAVYRDFDANQIRYMPLKGSVTKNWYPSPDMRTMTDVDVLVDDASLRPIEQIMKARDFRVVREGSFYDDAYFKPPLVKVEIHHQLFEPNSRYAQLNKLAWRGARRVDATAFRYEASPEVFYLHSVAHLAKHFELSGIDLRFLVDLWLMKKRRTETFDRSFVDRELDAFRLQEFVRNLERLTDVWFEGAPSDSTLDELGRYILVGADYRDISANQLMDQTTKPIGRLQKIAFLCSQLFLSKEAMARRYPIVARRPALLPFFWIRRLVDGLRNKETRQKIQGVLRVEKNRVDAMREFHRRTGLK